MWLEILRPGADSRRLGLPDVIGAGRHAQHLPEPLHGVVAALSGDGAVAAHWSSVCESLRSQQATGNGIFLKSPTPAPAADWRPAIGATQGSGPGPAQRPKPLPLAFWRLYATDRGV